MGNVMPLAAFGGPGCYARPPEAEAAELAAMEAPWGLGRRSPSPVPAAAAGPAAAAPAASAEPEAVPSSPEEADAPAEPELPRGGGGH